MRGLPVSTACPQGEHDHRSDQIEDLVREIAQGFVGARAFEMGLQGLGPVDRSRGT